MSNPIARPDVPPDTEVESAVKRGQERHSDQWAALSNGGYVPFGPTEKRLPPGCYEARFFKGDLGFQAQELQTDNLFHLHHSPIAKVVDSIEEFWGLQSRFAELGFIFKRGILLWGPPGTGKTAIINQIARKLVSSGGVVIIDKYPEMTLGAISLVRGIEGDRRIVHIVEDIERFFSGEQRGEQQSLLSLLDGQAQTGHIVHLATTNDPALADDRIVKRPSRFDEIIEVGPASRDARIEYLLQYLGKEEAEAWADDIGELPIAFLREMVVAVKCLRRDYRETLDRLHEMASKTPRGYSVNSGKVGL